MNAAPARAGRAARGTAMEPEPGMPKIGAGTRPPPSLASLGGSGAIAARMSPEPKRGESLAVWTAEPWAIQSTAEPPSRRARE